MAVVRLAAFATDFRANLRNNRPHVIVAALLCASSQIGVDFR